MVKKAIQEKSCEHLASYGEERYSSVVITAVAGSFSLTVVDNSSGPVFVV